MNYGISATRLTLYAFISSIEMDLRNFIAQNINEHNEDVLFSFELKNKLKSRGNKFEEDILELTNYLDFGDCICLINGICNLLPTSFKSEMKEIALEIEKLTPIRNRVMHSRPLEIEDFPSVQDFVSNIVKYKVIDWNETFSLKSKIDSDPSSIFNLKIPQIQNFSEDRIHHNLPPAEFDDTGFIGRKDEREKIKNQIISSVYPVISLIGDGGIGKTALTLRCLYDVLDEPNQPYEAIIWVSLKTRVLSNGEFHNVKNAIDDTLKMYTEISKELIGILPNSLDATMESILEYMSNFNILLVIDNLETINSDMIRFFLKSIPRGSRVVITSRIGIGEFETREKILGLEKKERIYYLRRLAKNYKLDDLLRMNDADLDEICIRLHSNPLAIKWFVINILKGDPIESILASQEELTEYCMSNVYDKLTNESKDVLQVMLIYNKKCSDAELDYLLDLDPVMHRRALNELVSTNMVRMQSETICGELKTLFYISDFARDYLQYHAKPDNSVFIKINKKINQLKGLANDLEMSHEIQPYDPKSIIANSQDEKIAAYYLRQALALSYERDYFKSIEFINKAKSAMPNYYEVYKISGFIHASNKDFFTADQEYLSALDCKGNYAPLLYLYAGFRTSFMEDFDGALKYCDEAEKLDQMNPEIKILKARILKMQRKHYEAEQIFCSLLNPNEYKLTDKLVRIVSDQAADNYKRWSEKAVAQNDYNSAYMYLERGLNIINVLDISHVDKKIAETLFKIINQLCVLICKHNQKQDLIYELIYAAIKKYQNQLNGCRKYRDSFTFIKNSIKYFNVEQRKILEELLEGDIRKLAKEVVLETEGYVHTFNNSFGFIVNKVYNEGLFFHISDCIDDFSLFLYKVKVSFEVGENDRGKIAKNVRIIAHFS